MIELWNQLWNLAVIIQIAWTIIRRLWVPALIIWAAGANAPHLVYVAVGMIIVYGWLRMRTMM